jgi:serine/threonine protein kinase
MAKQYGRWRNVGSLGEGGQAHVYLVEDSSGKDAGPFVLKRLRREGRLALFQQEIETTRSIEHPNIIRIVDFDLNAEKPYFVAEYCERGSLADIGAETFQGDVKAAARLLLPIVDALEAAHRTGVFHRDVKPPNILVRRNGEPVLADFGICHVESGAKVTLAINEPAGSLNYIAPEMESGRRLGPPCAETDGYSLAKVLYWMLSGGNIFAREDHRARSLVETLSEQRFEHVHSLLDLLMVEDPKKRISFTKLPGLMKKMEVLVNGNFAPLKPSIGIECRFCGLGRYQRIAGGNAGSISKIGIAQMAGRDTRALRCDHCGHLELFDFLDMKDNWWEN